MSTIAIPNDLQEMVDRLKAAMQSLVEGDPEPFKALTSQADDVTIFGALGVYKRGKDEARQDTEWVASRFHGGKMSIETFAWARAATWAIAPGSSAARCVWSGTTITLQSRCASRTYSAARTASGRSSTAMARVLCRGAICRRSSARAERQKQRIVI